MVGFTPQQQSALAQSLMQQGMQQPQGQMVGGHFVAPSLAQGLSNLASGFLGGRLQNIANQRQQQQQSELSQALLGGPQGMQERLAGLTDNPQAQQMMQQLALQEAMREPATAPQIIPGEQIGAPEGSVFQLTPQGYKEVYTPTAEKLPAGIIRDPQTGERTIDPLYMQMRSQIAEAGRAPAPVVNVGGGTTYEMGTIPQGFMAQYDEAGRPVAMVPVPGGPADIEAKEKEIKAEARKEAKQETAGLLTDDIARAKELVSDSPYLTTGFLGNVLKDWAGTGAADVKALMETIGANIGFDYLNEMRQNSPTGGALGNVSERELRLLTATAGSLEQSQSPEQFKRNLDRLEQQFLEVIHGPEGAAQVQAGKLITAPDAGIPQGIDPQDWEFMTPEERALFQ